MTDKRHRCCLFQTHDCHACSIDGHKWPVIHNEQLQKRNILQKEILLPGMVAEDCHHSIWMWRKECREFRSSLTTWKALFKIIT